MEENHNTRRRRSYNSRKMLYIVPVILLLCATAFFTVALSGYLETFGTFYSMLVRSKHAAPVERDLDESFDPYVQGSQPPPNVLTYNDLPEYPMDGEIIGVLKIDRIDLECNIYQGDGSAMLKAGAGHSFFSMLPGEGDNIVVSAHRTTFFRHLGDVQPGDLITITTSYGEYVYKMEESKIFYPADGEEIIERKPEETLTLYTCYPFVYRGNAPQRYAVICSLVSGTPADWSIR